MVEKRVIGRPFKKGVSGNPAGFSKAQAELVKMKQLTQTKFTDLATKYLDKTKADILEASKDPSTPVLELMLCSIMSKAIINGDQVRLNFLLERIIGKVPDKVQQTIKMTDSVDALLEELNKLDEPGAT